MSNIPIVYITDDNYIMPTVVSITSLLKNSKNKPEIYVIGVELSDKNKKIISEYNYVNLLSFNNKYENLRLNHPHVTCSALFKFDLAEIFPQYDKILYLDCDTLILDDLTPLLNTDIDEGRTSLYAGVIKDIFAVLNNGDNERIGTDNYFNSGVMLLNLKKMRENAIGAKLLDARLNLKSEKYMDQDVFNIVFKNCVKYLSPNFNYMLNQDNTIFSFLKFYNIKKISPIILHFAFLKPWKIKKIKYSKIWMKYYNLSPFKDEKLNLKPNPEKFKIYRKRKLNNRWVIDFLGLRFSYKKNGKDFKFFYP